MIKRDTLTRILLQPIDDEEGGKSFDEPQIMETIPAHISSGASSNEISMYGVKTQYVLHTTTDVKLDDRTIARYMWSSKLFKVMRQIKSGNEWFATLLEVNE